MASPGLVELATAEEEEAKRLLYRWVPGCHLASVLLTTVALFVALPAAYFLAVGVLLAQGSVWWLRRTALTMHRHADQARRRALLIATLGTSEERLDIGAIDRGFHKKVRERAQDLDRSDYWDEFGDDVPGLIAALQESAFWSANLFEAAAKRIWVVLGITGVMLAGLVLVGVVAFSGDTELAVARAIVVALSFLIALDLLGLALSWTTASREADTADRRLERMDGSDLEPVLAVFADYAIATSSVSPIPETIYEREHDEVDRRWREHRSGAG